MAHILILGGGAAGLAAALAAAQAAPAAHVTVLERNPKVGKKLLATGNGRCNLDNTAIAPEKYFTADPAALRPLLAAVDAAAPLAWFEQLGLYTRTDEAGRVYPYSNQAADVLALLELHLQRHKVQLHTGCTVSIHYSIVSGDKVKITFAPKGFGSENMSRVFMLKPADGIEGVKNAILTAVKDAGPNACPPMVIGVGVGGTFEKCALLAKKALTRPVGEHSDIEYVADMEKEMLEKINQLGIGPGGLGGTTTALAVNINTYPTHIAGLPVAINICCHVNRHIVRVV